MTSKKLSIIPIKSAIEASKKTKKAAPTPPAAPATVSRRKPRKPTSPKEEDEEIYELFSETESEEEESEKEEVKAKQYKPRTPPAVKKERSEKQIAVFQLALQRREENRILRKAEKDAKKASEKIVNEEKIIKKGLQLKKKQIIKEAILNDSESDVDIPNEIVQKVLKKKSKIKQVIEPQEKPPTVFKHSFNFV
jgi:hypothetical protein